MSKLVVHADHDPVTPLETTAEGDRIAAALAELGVRFERWSASRALAAGASQEEILAAYSEEVARLSSEGGYRSADVVRIARGTPDTAPMRRKFLAEHRHHEDEVRFFVEGSGSFYLHLGGRVYQVVCERGDLISVPEGTPHWFDMGTDPYFCAIRLFTSTEGWVAEFTGSDIASRFPTHDQAAASA